MWVVKVASKKPNATTINPRGLPGDFVYGVLNSIDRPKIGNSIDAYGTTYWDLVEYSIEATTRIDSLANSGPYRGVVLRVDTNPRAEKNFSDPDDASHYIYDRDVVGPDGAPPLVRVKVRVPELHSHLVPPANWGDKPGSHHREINLYPTYVAQDQSVPTPTPGDIVWVDYSNKNDFTDPIYIGPVRRRSFSGKGRGVRGSSRKKVEDPCDEEDATSGASGASGKTPASPHKASLGYPKGVRTGPEPPPTDESLEEQIVEAGPSPDDGVYEPDSKLKGDLKNLALDEDLNIYGWIAKLDANDKNNVIVMYPTKTDVAQPIELIIHLHGAKSWFSANTPRHILQNMKKMSDDGRNFILAYPEITFKRENTLFDSVGGEEARNDFFELYTKIIDTTKKLLSIENLEIAMNTITCHSRGGLILSHIARSGALNQIKPDKITLGDADYGRGGPKADEIKKQEPRQPMWATTNKVWEHYIKDSNKDIEYNLVVISPNTNPDDTKDGGPLPRYAAQLFVEEKLRLAMPTTKKKHYTKDLSDGAICYITYAPMGAGHSGIGRNHTITFNGHGPMRKPETPPSETKPKTDADHVTERPPEEIEEFVEGEDA